MIASVSGRWGFWSLLAVLWVAQPLWGQTRYWIFFQDKPETLSGSASADLRWLTPEALARRLQAGEGPLWSEEDLPVSSQYVRALQAIGVEPVAQSRWFNAVSAVLSEAQRAQVERLPFVRAVRPVARFVRPDPVELRPLPEEALPKGLSRGATGLDYGPSWAQLALSNVFRLHAQGLSGRGVRIGFLDAGFEVRTSPAFRALLAEGRLKGARDFVEGDADVSNTPSHGTAVLSVAVGYHPGRLIGPAYGAEVLLARTEDVSSETRQEEDFWVAGLEWLEAQGARLVNSSLGYTTFDGGIGDYSYTHMDGRTTLVTRAAQRAASRGVLVINAAGNEGARPWRYIVAPADGDSVIAVGAVRADSSLAPFSSRGPTYDGRIKPDVCALGVGVVLATPSGGYAQGSGTSFAAPIVTGILALLLERSPGLRPRELIALVRRSAHLADRPNNDYGYGILDAARLLAQATALSAEAPLEPEEELGAPYPHPFQRGVWIPLRSAGSVRAEVFSLTGERLRRLEQPTALGSEAALYWDGRAADGRPVAPGLYLLRVSIDGRVSWRKLLKAGL
ncbi:MAG: S8 family serine peptidase [Rhodothermia bacterium]|nr:S8 family serine peptidase [Rhodothermia bacterium]